LVLKLNGKGVDKYLIFSLVLLIISSYLSLIECLNLLKIFQNGCQGFSMDAYPIESLDGGELLVEFHSDSWLTPALPCHHNFKK